MNQELNQRWDSRNLENPHQLQDKKQRVQAMFSNVASTYDKVNHVISLNRDHHWRRQAAKLSNVQPDHQIVDVCCGTGDMAFAFARYEPGLNEIVGVDFVENMLTIAKQKSSDFLKRAPKNGPTFDWICSDAENIPLESNVYYFEYKIYGILGLKTTRPLRWFYLNSILMGQPLKKYKRSIYR